MATATHIVKQHVLSALSVTAITLNLLFWMLPVVTVVSMHALVRSPAQKSVFYRWLDRIYRLATSFHSWWITRILGVHLKVYGDPPSNPAEQLIVVSNHRSWFDILVLHLLVTGRGPIIKFLIKRELIYVPVVGWLCLALNFPRLHRGTSEDGRQHDYESVQAAATSLKREPGALLSFAEGTRFTAPKHRAQASPWTHLLKPRSGGLRIMLETLPDARILDCTLVYEQDLSFWQCLGGDLHAMEAWLAYVPAGEVRDVNAWLTERWDEKEARIAGSAIRTATT